MQGINSFLPEASSAPLDEHQSSGTSHWSDLSVNRVFSEALSDHPTYNSPGRGPGSVPSSCFIFSLAPPSIQNDLAQPQLEEEHSE